MRIQKNHIYDKQTKAVTAVKKLEPLTLRKEWMNDLTQAVAFLESLGLAHGDLRPENVLLDRNRIKLSDFDYTAKIGEPHEACMAPYGRLLNHEESDQGRRGSSGFLGSRTEQFALGSIYYLINYGFEVYGDRCLTEDPYNHGCKLVDLLQDHVYPELNGDPTIDNIIYNCWHNKYAKVSELAALTTTLLNDRTDAEGDNGSTKRENNEVSNEQDLGENLDVVEQNCLDDESLSRIAFCQGLEERGILGALSRGEPEVIGFTLEWYRHTTG